MKMKLKRRIPVMNPEKEKRLGGFMPNPPDDCKTAHFVEAHGKRWVDMGICIMKCQKRTNHKEGLCETARGYLLKLRKERNEHN